MLHDAELVVITSGHSLQGIIYNDKSTHGNHPFPDGTVVYTSTVMETIIESGDRYYVTCNTTYKEIKNDPTKTK